MIRRLQPTEVDSASAAVVDVREYPEYAAAAIPDSLLVPLSTIESRAETWPRHHPVVLVCRSGRRATDAAQRLQNMGFEHVTVLDGGIEAWQQAGLPVQAAQKKPWSLERQVRAIAGSMVVVSVVLGLAVSTWFFACTLFVGAGLTFAGISDTCFMATLLGKMPWNRTPASNQTREGICQ